MAPYAVLTVTALLFLLYGLLSRRLAHGMIAAATLGVAAGLAAGPLGSGWIELSVESSAVTTIAEVGLAVVLFNGAAATLHDDVLPAAWGLPARLLLIGLPLMLVLGVALARPLFPEMPLVWLAIMAAILAPSDASLSGPIVGNPEVPGRIRDLVGVDSGLGRGIILLPLLVLLALAAVSADASPPECGRAVLGALREIGLGAVLGAAVGWVGGHALDRAWRRGWMDETFARLVSPGLTVIAFGLAGMVGVDSLVAAYLAGLALSVRDPDLRGWLRDFGRADGMQFELFVYLLVGAAMLPLAVPYWDLPTLLYAVLSLTVVRMVAVALALSGAGVDRTTLAFVGWFGPRGVASVLYVALVIERFGVTGHEQLLAVVMLTVLLSIVLHGVSAALTPALWRRRARQAA